MITRFCGSNLPQFKVVFQLFDLKHEIVILRGQTPEAEDGETENE